MSWPHLYNRSCSPCGCALEECECAARQAKTLSTLPPVDELLSELDEPILVEGFRDEDLQ